MRAIAILWDSVFAIAVVLGSCGRTPSDASANGGAESKDIATAAAELQPAAGMPPGEAIEAIGARRQFGGRAVVPIGQGGGWRLVFEDEFNGSSLNYRKWATCYWWKEHGGCTNLDSGELQWYLAKNVTTEGGQLRLRAVKEKVRGYKGKWHPYTSGLVSTGRDVFEVSHRPRFEFRYGYVEIRARVPAGRGLWAASWMLPSSHDSEPEIDIMEVLGHKPDVLQVHLHYWDRVGTVHSPGAAIKTSDLSTGWHIFAVSWEPDRIVWYLDGEQRWRYDIAENIPAQPMYILLNLAVGGDWPGAPDDSTEFPANLLVDYVRVWQRPNR